MRRDDLDAARGIVWWAMAGLLLHIGAAVLVFR